MSQKLMVSLAAIATALILASMFIGAGSPITVVFIGIGIFVGLLALLSWRANKQAGRPTEFSYGATAPATWRWWTLLAAFLAVTYILAAVGQLISDPKATNVGAVGIAMGFAALIGGGLWLRSQARVAGNWMVAAGAVPALAFFWVIVPAVIGIAIILGAVAEVSRAPQAPVAT